MYSLNRCQLSSGPDTASHVTIIPSWDTEAYGRYWVKRYPQDDILYRQVCNPSGLRLHLDLIAREEERIIASLALYDKFFLPAEPVIEMLVKQPLMEIYRCSRTFRRLFNRWKMMADQGSAPGRWKLMPIEKHALSSQGHYLGQYGFCRDDNGVQQTCHPVNVPNVSDAHQILLAQLVWALVQNFDADEFERWAGASEYTNLIMREMAWPFPSLMRYMPTLLTSHWICPSAAVNTSNCPAGAAFESGFTMSNRHHARNILAKKVLQWRALTENKHFPPGKMSRYAQQEGLTYRTLSRYIGSTGQLTNRGKNLMAQAAVMMNEKLLASNVRTWLEMPEDQRWAAGGQKKYVRTKGLTLNRWRHYVSKEGKLTKRGQLLLARTAG